VGGALVEVVIEPQRSTPPKGLMGQGTNAPPSIATRPTRLATVCFSLSFSASNAS